MKRKFLFLLLVFNLLQVSVLSFADTMMTKQRILLRTKYSHLARSIIVQPQVFIERSLLYIDFLSVVNSVTIVVKNAETGENVYLCTESNVESCTIDLNAVDMGKYILEIEMPASAFIGEFEL